MSKKTPGQILKESLEAEAEAIRKAMADAEIASKTKKAGRAVASKVEELAEDVAEEIVDDSNALMKKVKAFLPSRSTALHAFKIIAYWEIAKLVLEFVL